MNALFSRMKVGKATYSEFIILMFLQLSACSNIVESPMETVEYKKPMAEECDSDPANKYHILIPGHQSPVQKLPLVIVLDAHGDGEMAVNKFMPAVRYFPCLVAGSDWIRNNFPGFENAIGQLLSDIQNKYPVDARQIIIAGFSGGARMAYYFSLDHPVKAVLMCGAGPGKQKPSCPIYAISGMGDFNFAEQYAHPDIQSFGNNKFTSDYFEGIHEWPKPQQLTDALLCLLGDNNDLNKIRRRRSPELIRLADSLTGTRNDLMAWKALEKAAKISVSKRERKRAVERGKSLLNNEDYRTTIKSLEEYLNFERRLQQSYSQRIFNEDHAYWKNELSALNKKLKTDTTGISSDHYLRIKGFIGILLYSVVNKMIYSDPGNPQIGHILETYAFAEPENPDPWYFKALHAYRSGDQESCIEFLDRSLKLGFSEHKKLERDFPGNILDQVIH